MEATSSLVDVARIRSLSLHLLRKDDDVPLSFEIMQEVPASGSPHNVSAEKGRPQRTSLMNLLR